MQELCALTKGDFKDERSSLCLRVEFEEPSRRGCISEWLVTTTNSPFLRERDVLLLTKNKTGALILAIQYFSNGHDNEKKWPNREISASCFRYHVDVCEHTLSYHHKLKCICMRPLAPVSHIEKYSVLQKRARLMDRRLFPILKAKHFLYITNIYILGLLHLSEI